MKTLSPVREQSSMPSMIISSSGRSEIKPALQPLLVNSSGTQMSGHVEKAYDSELNNNIRMWREKRLTMGHPGHYYVKPLNSENSRSQSLPSCLDEKKPRGPQEETVNEETPVSLQEHNEDVSRDQVALKEDGIPSNQTWFKTWPERGSDKIIPETAIRSHLVGDVPADDVLDGCVDKMLSLNLSNGHHCIVPSNNSPSCLGNTNSQRKLNNFVNGCNNYHHSPPPIHNFSSFEYDTSDQKVCAFPVQNTVKSIPLTEILENMPLAYNPMTRQLHIINQNYIQNGSACEERKAIDEDALVVRNGVKPLDCIIEEKVSNCKATADNALNNCDDSISYESPRSTLQRINVYDNSLTRTDASSFSSIVSSLSESSPSTNEDLVQGNFVDQENVVSPDEMQDSLSMGEMAGNFEELGAKPKRRGISSFFSRNVFSWKLSRESAPTSTSASSSNNCSNASTWKLFSKSAKLRQGSSDEDTQSTGSAGKQYEDIVASSSALILHQRPSNLPAKSLDEELKHRHEYERMVEAARKKELKEAKLRKKQLQQQLKIEEQLANAARIWNNEILPKWDFMKSSRKAQDLWWQGIPPSVRGKIWRLAIGNDLNITHQLYDICVARAQERLKAATEMQEGKSEMGGDNPDKEASVELIQLDIARTFPNLCIFQKGGPYYDILHSLLGAYVCYRPDVGYVQGMSFIAAVLILNLEAADAFVCFANLLNQPCHMAFFRLNQPLMQAYYSTYNDFFKENLPRLHSHFTESSLTADLYLLDWLYTVFAKAMPLDVACRVWDVFLRDGEEFLFKTALGVLHHHQDILLQLDFLHGAQFLTKLPDDLAADQLFKSIESIRMNVGKLRFSEVLAGHIEGTLEPS